MNTIAINSVEGKQADCVPPQICSFPGVLAPRTSGVRADLPRKFADPISEKEDTCSISPHLLLSIYERCQKKTGVSVLMGVFYFPLVLPHNPDNKRKV